MKLEATNHEYYCSNSNYYVGDYNGENHGLCEYETWNEFKEDWMFDGNIIDHDYNHCFRFDIRNKYDEEKDEDIQDEYYLELFFILQRKGIFRPVIIKTIKEDDMYELEQYLKECCNYLKKQWEEVEV